ncbi:hypothetical protein SAY87_019605 [Trapa incisa]|uniref:Bifunctional inhibitor/plant lipid transfer protein/seed storage helical domain-containing protein n=1 Tax=Trapa incisa TaxID=236973 RepID=A0AAN7K2I7_9MYRT|nr:hypothetical protein SAY87_019605 [Trapa incisa]
MASLRSSLLQLAAVIAVAFMFSAEAQQSSTPSCAQKLLPCGNYLNSTNPPDTCCNPIKEAVATDRVCLCNLYNTPGLLESFGVNITQALQLTRACGVDANTSLCNETASPPTSSTSPPAVPGGDNNDAGRVMLSGLPGMLLLWASMLLLY